MPLWSRPWVPAMPRLAGCRPFLTLWPTGTVGLVTLRSGADHYTFEFIVNANKIADGTFTSYSDSAKGANTADAATALA